jgi:DNA polymerase-4
LYRHIIHLHIPAFSIAVERVCHPELRGRPVVVAAPSPERAPVLSASIEARREGVFKSMPVSRALKVCPELTVLPPNPKLTERARQDLEREVARYTPLWEPSRPGHIYLDVTGTERLWGRAKDAADRLRAEVKSRLCLAGTVGVAANKMVSSIASRIMPSEGVLDVDHGWESLFMAPLRVGVLPGIGPVGRRILLEDLNITLVWEIAVMDVADLALVFGRQAGLIHQRALGIDPTPVYPCLKKPAISEDILLAGDENDDAKLLGILYGLVEKCTYRLRKGQMHPRRAGLMLRYADQVEIVRQIRLPHGSFWDFDLFAALKELFFKACQRRVRVRFIRVWFRDFAPPSSQLSLFPETVPSVEKKVPLTLALDRIRERYGSGAVSYGRAL